MNHYHNDKSNNLLTPDLATKLTKPHSFPGIPLLEGVLEYPAFYKVTAKY